MGKKRKQAKAAEVEHFVDHFFAELDAQKYAVHWYAPPPSELDLPTQIIIDKDWAADHGLRR